MPEPTAKRNLTGNVHFPGVEVDYAQTRRLFAGAGRTPCCLLAGIGPLHTRAFDRLSHARNTAMSHNGKSHLIKTDYRLVRYPLILRLRVQRTQSAAVGIHHPCALRRFTPRFPAENYLSRHPGIRLHMSYLKRNRSHILQRPAFKMYPCQTTWSRTHLAGTKSLSRSHIFRQICSSHSTPHPKPQPILLSIQSHIAMGTIGSRNRGTKPLIMFRLLQATRSTVTK